VTRSPTVHLLKVFVGLATLPELAAFQQEKLAVAIARGKVPELSHVTRNWPKRADDLLAGGSIFWIMSGAIVARQRLTAFRLETLCDVPHWRIVFDPTLIAVVPRPHRPFQGWRYLPTADAPPDIERGSRPDGIPAAVAVEQAKLGLL
jgi:hypothetical protein